MSRQELNVAAGSKRTHCSTVWRWREAQSRAMEALETWLQRKRQWD